MSDDTSQEWISIAQIVRPQGLRGEVIADLLTDFPDRFADLDEVTLRKGLEVIGVLKLEKFWFHKGRIVLKFAGINDANQAETLRGISLVISPDKLVELDEDEYFLFDLEGCEVVTVDGSPLGIVKRIDDFGAAPILVVSNEGREYMIPLTHDICPEVDTDSKKIVVNPPQGLLDL